MNTAKAETEALLRRLPDNCTFEDIQYHIYVLDKVRRGLEAADTEGALTQQEAEERLKKWTMK